MVAVPVLARRDGDVIGVIVLHTEAPREFDDGRAQLPRAHGVAGRRARSRTRSSTRSTRRRVDALTTLTQLSQSLAAVTLREDLYDAVTRGARQLLGADACQIWRIDPEADGLELAGSDPPDAPATAPGPGRAADGAACERGRSGAVRRRAAGGAAGGGRRAARHPRLHRARAVRFDDEDAELLRAVAHQTAVGLKKAELIERLTAENIVKDMFEALAAGSVETAEAKAGEARCDLSRPHVFLHAERAPGQAGRLRRGPSWPLAFEGGSSASTRAPSSTRATTALRALAPLPTRHGRRRAAAPGRARSWRASAGLIVGLSDVDRGAASAPAPDARGGGRGAHRAARWRRTAAPSHTSSSAPTATWCTSSSTTRRTTATGQAVEELIEYDRAAQRRGSSRRSSAILGASLQRGGERAGALHPSEHGASAARAGRARDGARPRPGGPAVARARAQGRPPPRVRGDRE